MLPGIAEKLISSNLCRVMEGKEPIKCLYFGQRKIYSVAMGFGMQRIHKKIFKPKKHEKCCQIPTKSQFEKQ